MGGLDYIDSLLADCFFTRIWMYLISKGPKPQLVLGRRGTWDDFFLGLMGELDGSGIKRPKATAGIGREGPRTISS